MRKAVILAAVMAFAMMLCFGLRDVSADSVLFPYFTSGGGDLTFIQIINTKADETIGQTNPDILSSSADFNETLHYTYVYNTDEEICQHFDDDGDTSENDILLYEVTDALAPGHAGQLLPGDTTSTSPALTVSPAWGYLVVDNDNWGNFEDDRDEGTLQGQEIIVNTDNMYAYTLNGINDPAESECGSCHGFNWSAENAHTLSFLPEYYANTVWYLFPVDGDEITDTDPNDYGIEECTSLDDCYVEIGSYAGGIYNNNESLKSGTPRVYPGCIYEDEPEYAVSGKAGWQSNDFFYSLEEILTGAQYSAVKGTGGWFDIRWYTRNPYPYDYKGYAYKLITSNIFGKTMVNIVYEPGNPYTINGSGVIPEIEECRFCGTIKIANPSYTK